MANKRKIFDEHELYDLVCAQYFANNQEEETGYSSDWSEFAHDLQYKFEKLTENEQDKLEKLLNDTTIKAKDYIEMLNDLKEDDFDTEEDFSDEREELQRKITDLATKCLRDYWNGN